MSEENVALVRSLYEDFAAGDVASMLGKMAPDVIWNEAENFPYADRNPYRGPQAIGEQLLARVAADWELAVIPEEIVDGGDTIVVLGRYRGPFRASGALLDAQLAHVWRVRDGRVARFDGYADTLQAARITGAA